MPLSDEDLDKIAARVWNYKLEAHDTDPPKKYDASWFVSRIHELSRSLKPDPEPEPKKKATTPKQK